MEIEKLSFSASSPPAQAEKAPEHPDAAAFDAAFEIASLPQPGGYQATLPDGREVEAAAIGDALAATGSTHDPDASIFSTAETGGDFDEETETHACGTGCHLPINPLVIQMHANTPAPDPSSTIASEGASLTKTERNMGLLGYGNSLTENAGGLAVKSINGETESQIENEKLAFSTTEGVEADNQTHAPPLLRRGVITTRPQAASEHSPYFSHDGPVIASNEASPPASIEPDGSIAPVNRHLLISSLDNRVTALLEHRQSFTFSSIRQLADDKYVVRLDPPELGSVRITIRTDDNGTLKALVSAERNDTLDLLRRHIDIFRSEAASSGFERLDFQFEAHSRDRSGNQNSKKKLQDQAGLPNNFNFIALDAVQLAEFGGKADRWV